MGTQLTRWSVLDTSVVSGEQTAKLTITGTIGYNREAESWAEYLKNTFPSMQRELMALGNLKVKKLEMTIASYGGDVNHALAIHDVFAGSEIEITTIMIGHTASAGTILGQCASPGRRFQSANALSLIHQPWGWREVNLASLPKIQEEFQTHTALLLDLYAKNSPDKRGELDVLMQYDSGMGKWLSATAALELGLIDEIYEPQAMAASYGKSLAASIERGLMPALPPEYQLENSTQEGNKVTNSTNTLAASGETVGNEQNKNNTMEQKMDPKDLKVFNDLFGPEEGMKFALSGKSLEDCKNEHLANQKEALVASATENATLAAKIVELEASAAKAPVVSAEEQQKVANQLEAAAALSGTTPVKADTTPAVVVAEEKPKTFDELVSAEMAANSNLKKSVAIMNVRKANPELHAAWLAKAGK